MAAARAQTSDYRYVSTGSQRATTLDEVRDLSKLSPR